MLEVGSEMSSAALSAILAKDTPLMQTCALSRNERAFCPVLDDLIGTEH